MKNSGKRHVIQRQGTFLNLTSLHLSPQQYKDDFHVPFLISVLFTEFSFLLNNPNFDVYFCYKVYFSLNNPNFEYVFFLIIWLFVNFFHRRCCPLHCFMVPLNCSADLLLFPKRLFQPWTFVMTTFFWNYPVQKIFFSLFVIIWRNFLCK